MCDNIFLKIRSLLLFKRFVCQQQVNSDAIWIVTCFDLHVSTFCVKD
jgi:hypothetical protein